MQTFVPALAHLVVLSAPAALSAQVVYVPAPAAVVLISTEAEAATVVFPRPLRDRARLRRDARHADELRASREFTLRVVPPPREPRARMRIGRPDDRFDYRMLQLPPDQDVNRESWSPRRPGPRRQR